MTIVPVDNYTVLGGGLYPGPALHREVLPVGGCPGHQVVDGLNAPLRVLGSGGGGGGGSESLEVIARKIA